MSLAGVPYIERADQYYCEKDYHEQYSPKCGKCQEVLKGPYVQALEQTWHPQCFVCSVCCAPFTTTNTFRKYENKPFCEKHYLEMFAEKCYRCNLPIQKAVFEALKRKYHPECFVCDHDEKPIGEGSSFHIHEQKIYCSNHFSELFQRKCTKCQKPILDQFIKINDQPYHSACWSCDNCERILQDGRYEIISTGVLCYECSAKLAAANLSAAAEAIDLSISPSSTKLESYRAEKSFFTRAPSVIASDTSSRGAKPSNITKFYNYSDLCLPAEKMSEDINLEHREAYLSETEFAAVFKMSKTAFYELKKWKQDSLKKQFHLF